MNEHIGSGPNTYVDETERQAFAVWGAICEPGDVVANELVKHLGANGALEWLRELAEQGRSAARTRRTGSVAQEEAFDFAAEDVVPGREGVGFGAGSRLLGIADNPAGVRVLENRIRLWSGRLETVKDPLSAGRELGHEFVVPGDPRWPHYLDDLAAAAPLGLWVDGGAQFLDTEFSDGDFTGSDFLSNAVALVGARAATTYGQHVTAELAHGLSTRGFTIVSGGAYGIDAVAHQATLNANGRTVVVLPGGLDRPYPAGHGRLFAEVLESGGTLISEAPPGTAPTRRAFLSRNRLIAALSRATVVVEAAWRSGALSTANHAAGLLRPVGAVPGPVTSAASAGCHRLLREQVAVCVTDVDDVADLVGGIVPEKLKSGRRTQLDDFDDTSRLIHDELSLVRATTVDELIQRTGVQPAPLRAALVKMELAGIVRRVSGGWCAIKVTTSA